jgi:uncharacterized protein YeaO (DUF488 family)
MKIYTSYFGNIRNVKNPVSIAVSPPKWYSGPKYIKLAPSWDLVKKYKEKCKEDLKSAIDMYTRIYYTERLNILRPDTVFVELSHIYNGDDVVLLCYEKPEKFCHRHIVKTWFWLAGIEVKELE